MEMESEEYMNRKQQEAEIAEVSTLIIIFFFFLFIIITRVVAKKDGKLTFMY